MTADEVCFAGPLKESQSSVTERKQKEKFLIQTTVYIHVGHVFLPILCEEQKSLCSM